MAEPITSIPEVSSGYDAIGEELGRLRENLGTSHLLELLNGLLELGPEAAAVVLDRMDNPGTRRGLENLVRILEIVGDLDPIMLTGLGNGLRIGAIEAHARTAPSFVSVIKSVVTPEFRKGIAVGIAILRGLGSVDR